MKSIYVSYPIPQVEKLVFQVKACSETESDSLSGLPHKKDHLLLASLQPKDDKSESLSCIFLLNQTRIRILQRKGG